MADLPGLTIAAAREGLRCGAIEAIELTEACLSAAEASAPLNAFTALTADLARSQARAAAARLGAGDAPDLCGIPLGIKDLFCVEGVRSQAGSTILSDFAPPYESSVTRRLWDAGAVCIGKLNMDEFAMGSSNETSCYGPAVSPWRRAGDNRGLTPGGSSGGSAAAVAGDLVLGATGTDTGGSIRQPAAFTGIVGVKPTYGRCSRWGMIAFASSLDQAGPMTRSAEDAAIMLTAMAGFDERDSTCAQRPVDDYVGALRASIRGLRIGIVREFMGDGLDAGVAAAIEQALNEYKALGAELVEISLPNAGLSVPAYYVVAPAECSSNLARFDGVRYGHRCDDPKDLEDLYKRSRSEGFGAEVKRRIMIGTYALSAGYYDAYYLKAQKVRQLIADDFRRAFDQCDVIAGPTAPGTAFRIGDKADDPVSMYLQDIYTIAVNLAGLPGMSIPAPHSGGMPVGLQLIGNYFDEARLLNVAHQLQLATDWHQQVPAEFA